MQIAVLALSSSHGPWDQLLKYGPERTWLLNSRIIKYCKIQGRDFSYRDKIINLVLNSRFADNIWIKRKINLNKIILNESKNNKLIIDLGENWGNLTIKTLKGLEYLLSKCEFDYLIRINSTAYIEVEKLIGQLGALGWPDYAGPIAKDKSFVSGWAIILSRKAMEILIKAPYQDVIFDDEFIGRELARKNVFPMPLPYLEFNANSDVSINRKKLMSTAIWRFKILNSNGVRCDNEYMKIFHNEVLKDG